MSLSDSVCLLVRELVRGVSGIVLDVGKEYLVESRLTALARREGMTSLESLVARFRAEPWGSIRAKVIEAMTTNETSFFRDALPFEALRKVLLPDLIQRRARERTLTVWCAAASSGQEPYSLAMLIRESFRQLDGWNVRILATDLSREALDRARAGLYTQVEISRGLPAPLLAKYFAQQGVHWRINDDLKKMVEFRHMNLMQSWPVMPPPDIVMLRNVLIYFDVPTKKMILGKVRQLLRPDGYLFLGAAETTMHLDGAFERVPVERSCCFRLLTGAN